MKPGQHVIVVGASTGGTEALRVFLMALPPQAPPVLIVQHMPEMFVPSFVARLDGLCAVHVRQAEHHAEIQSGHAYVSPGHSHLLVARISGRLVTALSDAPPVNRHRPSVEVLFHSAAKVLQTRAVGVMLTGMGRDGAAAMLEMKRAGAYNLAQDEASSVVFGMPRAAIELGAVDEVASLERMAARVLAVAWGTAG